MTTRETTSSALINEETKPQSIAIQGYSGAFHEIAARFYFKNQKIKIAPADTFEDLVEMVENERADRGLMAIENTLAGSIMYNYNLLYGSNLKIAGEVFLRIKQNLMALPGQKIKDIREVHSHPMAIAQCRPFFKKYPHIRLIETADTALSAKEIRENEWKQMGAIASTLAAEIYGLEIIAEGIETDKLNYTRFLVLRKEITEEVQVRAESPDERGGNGRGLCENISRQSPHSMPSHQPGDSAVTGKVETANKVSLCFCVEHEVGSLHKVLAVMAAYNINLTKIQSAPIVGRQWEYLFFVDFVIEGKVGWRQALDAIRPLTTNLKLLGAYRAGAHFEF